MDDSFITNILPLIDAEAAQQGTTRADIVRDILYSSYYHNPAKRSQAQIAHDANMEQKYNKEGYKNETLIAYPCLWVCVEPRFFDLYMMDAMIDPDDDEVSEPDKTMLENYLQLSRDALQEHFFHSTALACPAL